ncbi:potassium channel family protein [Arthrobacter sp. Sr24]|uniref:potassium channel family protein n=1 Tax=Arthrobacter sp. N199823 TaxID=2058895 RepID=UPI000CE53DC5|nr:potassium channel family protein [Arthrobacter sp. N199823]
MTLEQWERFSEWPLICISVLFLAAYSVQVLASESVAQIAGWFMMTTWVLFLIDYGISLWLAPQRLNWFFRHIHELAIVVLPMLRPLRLLRLVTLIGVLQRVAGNALRGRVVTYVIAASALLTYIGALAMYEAEKTAAEASINSFADAAWWAVVTITTVGYGDLSPVTTTGRLVAVGLMIGGIALLGTVTATLASWLVDKVSAEDVQTQSLTVEHVELLHEEIKALRREISSATGTQNSTVASKSEVEHPSAIASHGIASCSADSMCLETND